MLRPHAKPPRWSCPPSEVDVRRSGHGIVLESSTLYVLRSAGLVRAAVPLVTCSAPARAAAASLCAAAAILQVTCTCMLHAGCAAGACPTESAKAQGRRD